jgi:hypothetical protein
MSLPQEDIITKLKGEKRLWIVSVLRAMGLEDAICCATLVPKTHWSINDLNALLACTIMYLWNGNKIN